MLLHREVEEGLRSGDDDIVDELMKRCPDAGLVDEEVGNCKRLG